MWSRMLWAMALLCPAAAHAVCEDPCESLEKPEALRPWTGAAMLSLNLHAGNTRLFLIEASGLAEYATDRWVATIKGDASFEKAAGADEDSLTIAEAASLTLRGERRLTSLLGIFLLAEASTDHLANVKVRLDGEAGVAFTLTDRFSPAGQHHLLRLDLGVHYSNEDRYRYFISEGELPNVDLLSPALRLAFYYPINERVIFIQYAQVLPNVLGDARVLIESNSKLSTALTARLAINLNLKFDVDTDPADGVGPTDLALLLGGEFAF